MMKDPDAVSGCKREVRALNASRFTVLDGAFECRCRAKVAVQKVLGSCLSLTSLWQGSG